MDATESTNIFNQSANLSSTHPPTSPSQYSSSSSFRRTPFRNLKKRRKREYELARRDRDPDAELKKLLFQHTQRNKQNNFNVSSKSQVLYLLLASILIFGFSLLGSYISTLFSHSSKVSDNGIMQLDSSSRSVTTGETVRLEPLIDLARLDMTTLRAIRDVAFVHRRTYHYFRIGSFLKYSDQLLVLHSLDGNTKIRIEKSRIFLSMQYHVEEEVDPLESSSSNKWVSHASFTIETAENV